MYHVRVWLKNWLFAILDVHCGQNEALNGGGKLFVDKHPNLRVRVVHGNTLTAAVIIDEIPKDVEEVFLTGATSKLGRAIALYLCQKKVKVLVSLPPAPQAIQRSFFSELIFVLESTIVGFPNMHRATLTLIMCHIFSIYMTIYSDVIYTWLKLKFHS